MNLALVFQHPKGMENLEMNSIVGCDCPLCSRIRELENYLDEVLKSEDGRIVRAKAILKEFNVGLDRREWVDRALAALEGK